MSKVSLNQIIKNGKTVEYRVTIDAALKKYFYEDNILRIEYPFDIEDIPDNILAVPFVGNVLPIIWVTGDTLCVNELDKRFVDHLPEVKKGYETMYPQYDFSGQLVVDKAIENKLDGLHSKKACFFSGGMDATTTLINHIDEKPDLMIIWGSDIRLDDKSGWDNVEKHVKSVAREHKLEYLVIKSNFRTFINYNTLNELTEKIHGNWWHEFQHGIGIITHAAPLSYVYNYDTIYIASSYSKGMEGRYTCASDPLIDNYVEFCGCHTVHDGFELKRQDKARIIVAYRRNTDKDVNLRVCYQEANGVNCCECEKCYRSILEIVSEGGNPNDYGFTWNSKSIKKCKRKMLYRITTTDMNIEGYYKPLQNAFEKNKDKIRDFDKYKWVVDTNFDRFNDYFPKRVRKVAGRLKRFLKRVI